MAEKFLVKSPTESCMRMGTTGILIPNRGNWDKSHDNPMGMGPGWG